MSNERFSDARILAAWEENAQPWSDAVRAGRIASRRLVTDRAIITAVLDGQWLDGQPRSVLDLGCGEGWLAHELTQRGMRVTGVDAVPALIELARERGQSRFETLDYAAIADGALEQRFDAIVANFALLGDEVVTRLFAALPRLLQPHGRILVQTLHPLQSCGEHAYVDGWREGSWAGIDGDFGAPAPWYFRTIASWIALIAGSDLQLLHVYEPLDPRTARPASMILIAGADTD